MQITFYKTNSEKNRINKSLESPLSIEGNLQDETSLVTPTITVALNTAITLCNYCYIPAFNRYYYIEDISVTNKMLIINLKCDVLMSFKNDILNSTAIITRTNRGNKYISDNLIQQTSKFKRQVKKIGNGFTRNEMFIIQIGG